MFEELHTLLALTGQGAGGLLVVPDTNALLREPDVLAYAAVVGSSEYTVVLLPAVLSELDDLKDRGRTPDVRERAEKAVRRLKGLRDRGDLRAGVPVAGGVRLKAEHWDVDPGSILGWLNASVPDDRILAAALDVQARSPACTLVLVTADLNLQNKAAVAGLPFVDLAGGA